MNRRYEMKKKLLIIVFILCLLVGCGKKENLSNPDNVLEKNEQNIPNAVLEEMEKAKISAAQNSFYGLQNVTQMFYLECLVDNNEFEKTTFICNGTECSNGKEKLEILGDTPSSGEITINEDGTTIFSDIVINGYKCNIQNSGNVSCSK